MTTDLRRQPQQYVRHLLAGTAAAPPAPAAYTVERFGVGLAEIVAAGRRGLVYGVALSTVAVVLQIAATI